MIVFHTAKISPPFGTLNKCVNIIMINPDWNPDCSIHVLLYGGLDWIEPPIDLHVHIKPRLHGLHSTRIIEPTLDKCEHDQSGLENSHPTGGLVSDCIEPRLSVNRAIFHLHVQTLRIYTG